MKTGHCILLYYVITSAGALGSNIHLPYGVGGFTQRSGFVLFSFWKGSGAWKPSLTLVADPRRDARDPSDRTLPGLNRPNDAVVKALRPRWMRGRLSRPRFPTMARGTPDDGDEETLRRSIWQTASISVFYAVGPPPFFFLAASSCVGLLLPF